MALEIKSVDEDPGPWKILLYGPSGSGKTVLGASFPGVLVVDVERGSRSLLNHPELRGVKTLKVKSYEDVFELFWKLKAGEFPEIETVMIDSISELQMRHLDETLDKISKKDRNRSRFLPFQNDYKENTQTIRGVVTMFRDLDRNLILTAHDIEVRDEANGTILIRPEATPKLASTIRGIMDAICYLTAEPDNKGNPQRRLRVQPNKRILAKSRLNFGVNVVENPTAKDILEAAKYMLPDEAVAKQEAFIDKTFIEDREGSLETTTGELDQ
jgi:phage nucleotide-binding protein